MSDITVILTAYRRPHTLRPQVEAVRGQTVPAREVWVWANDPGPEMLAALRDARPDRVVTCSANAYFHARFALALTAPTEYVALFDDDAVPGPGWFAGCLETMARTPGILGAAGVRLLGPGYGGRSLHGWHAPSDRAVEVDLVGHAWFLRAGWVRHLFAAPPVVGTNGEDIELAARAWRLGGVRCYCPPHPQGDRAAWGSARGDELGGDEAAASRRPGHLDERDRVVRAEVAAGWAPLYLREGPEQPPEAAADLPGPRPAPGVLGMVPESARQVLLVGRGAAALAPALRARQPARVYVLAPDDAAVRAAGEGLDGARAGDVERLEPARPEAGFDCVVCDPLDGLREPERLLRRARGWLGPGGLLAAAAGNGRHHAVVTALLDGTWGQGPGALPGPSPLRVFTRREVEKLFFRAGFAVAALCPVPGPGHAEWAGRGRPGEVRAGRLHVRGLAGAEAEEFHDCGFLVAAAPAPEPAYGLTSVVIVTHDQLAYTRACVDSVRLRTDGPYELVFVDNGSTDGTPDYLRSVPGAKVVLNPDNRGFPAAANQGLRAAAGDQVVLLNNDTVVTTGWLARLLRALHSGPRVGLAGPCSNYVSGEQQVPAGYDDLADLDGFAWDRGKAHDRVTEDTDRLVGFCLLVRRAVLDEVGLLDERFGVGCFEDDDYCRRALGAGWRAVIARDAFVHHFGGRTFAGAGVDFAGLMRRNEQLFRDKWAAPAAETTETTSGVAAAAPPGGRYGVRAAPGGGLLLTRADTVLSLCLIARDNARTLAPCLESIRPWVDEMVVVDTGSEDETPRVARRLGAHVFRFPWCDDFAAARNESLRHARGRWLFWMDSDDTIDADNGRKLRELARGAHDPSVLGYVLQVHCPGPGENGRSEVTVVDHVKLFRNLPGLRFDGRIHEQILPAVRRAGGQVAWTDVFVTHSGYDHTPGGQSKKLERDLRLLHLELRERPDHPFTLFNLGMTYADAGRHEEALQYLGRSVARAGEGESHLRKAYALMVSCHDALGRPEDAREACREGLGRFPLDAELRFRRGVLLHRRGDLPEAARTYQDLLGRPDDRHFSSVVTGVGGFLARTNLALVYRDLGDPAREEEQWRLVVRERPGYRTGWRGLGEALLRQGRHDEALRLAERLLSDAALPGEGRLLLGLLAAGRGDPDTSRRELERAARECPDDPGPRQALCRLLFEHGTPAEAERALAEMLRRDPHDASAHHNLGTVYLRAGRYPEAAEAYRQSLRHRPAAPDTHLHLGHALRGCGRLGEAAVAWEEVLRLRPGDAEAAAALREARRAS